MKATAIVLAAGVLLAFASSPARAFDQSSYPPPAPVLVVYDTDMRPDCDDVGALAVLHTLADAGLCKILAVGISADFNWSAACADAINTYYMRPDIPIGIVKHRPNQGAYGPKPDYADVVGQNFPNDMKDNLNDIPEACFMYREILAGQEDHSVTMISVGFLGNLAKLLDTPADEHSDLNGKQLVAKKVQMWVCMGGQFPQGQDGCNLKNDGASAQKCINEWPTPVVFSGGEIGQPIITGAVLTSGVPATNPVRKAYEIYNGLNKGRNSWDLTACLYAVKGLGPYWNIHDQGRCSVTSGGYTTWNNNAAGTYQGYLVKKMSNDGVKNVLDSLMIEAPRGDPVATHRPKPLTEAAPVPGEGDPRGSKLEVFDARGRAVSFPPACTSALGAGMYNARKRTDGDATNVVQRRAVLK